MSSMISLNTVCPFRGPQSRPWVFGEPADTPPFYFAHPKLSIITLTVFRQRFTTDWGPLMAGVAIATAPMIVVFLLFQRYFVSGVALTGLKG